MSNHYHIVLHIKAEKAKAWTDSQVIERWRTLYSGNFLTQQYMAGKDLYEEQLKVIAELATEWRERLMSISWFMRALNEDIARQANAEDGCTAITYGNHPWFPPLRGSYSLRQFVPDKLVAITLQIPGLAR